MLERMERLGIARALLSISAPGVDFGDAAFASRLARDTNDLLIRMRQDDPGRIGGFAILPLPHVDAALAELKRLEGSGLEGIVLLTNYRGRYLSHADFWPVLEALNQRGTLVFLHPQVPPGAEALGLLLPPPILEFTFDTTRCVADMIFSGTLDRVPNIDWVLSHLGGTLPMLAWRMSMIEHSPRPAYAAFRERGRGVADYLGALYYDTAVSAGPPGLAATLALAGVERIVYGSDLPFLPFGFAERTAVSIDSSLDLSDADRQAIAFGNARRLLDRPTL
jgi:predicted TIM-barrel fold metal-dependent hydrolase